ncbi:hypothetical protein C8R45DRAFT_989058 [Mycena sanguinolenta]|nr:hypothetical protein C8R45DRAFT_989058 [Mycena sanguinolenta]
MCVQQTRKDIKAFFAQLTHLRPPAIMYSQSTLRTDAPRQFVPYLYLSSPSFPGAPLPPGNWTHTLRLLPPTKTRPAGSTDIIGNNFGGPRELDVHIPAAAFKQPRTSHLSTDQLLLARDFLALALPYYASAHPPASPCNFSGGSGWPVSSPRVGGYPPITHAPLQGLAGMVPRAPANSQADPVRVLVLGPPQLVLAIGLLYLAYASGCSVKQVARGVMEDRDNQWRRLIAEDGQLGLSKEDMKLLERVVLQDIGNRRGRSDYRYFI